jgi:hypothetical protein
MPLSKAGKKIKAKLEKQYGEKKGEGIFYAMENKGEIPGMNKMKGYAAGGMMKEVPEDNKGLSKLPEEVRNNMGYMAKGGMVKGYNVGGMVKATGTLNTNIRKCGE